MPKKFTHDRPEGMDEPSRECCYMDDGRHLYEVGKIETGENREFVRCTLCNNVTGRLVNWKEKLPAKERRRIEVERLCRLLLSATTREVHPDDPYYLGVPMMATICSQSAYVPCGSERLAWEFFISAAEAILDADKDVGFVKGE